MNCVDISINRHILSDVMRYRTEKKQSFVEFSEQYDVLSNLAKNWNFWYCAKSIDEEQREKSLKEIRDEFFKVLCVIKKTIFEIRSCDSKEEVLLMYLVSEIKKVEEKGGE